MFISVAKLDGAIRSQPSSPEPDTVPIPNGSRFFLQLPGDHVLEGILEYRGQNPLPSWIFHPNQAEDNSQPSVYLRRPFFSQMLGHMQTLHNNHNSNVQIFRIFIKLTNNSIMSAFLRPGDDQILSIPHDTRIFVRLPAPYNATYFGVLRFRDGWRPEWIY